jgi:hypothetical protein
MNRSTDIYAISHCSQCPKQGKRAGQVAVVHHVMLRHKDAIKTRFFGYLRGLDSLAHASADMCPIRWILYPEQYPEFHFPRPTGTDIVDLTNRFVCMNIKTAMYVYFRCIAAKCNIKVVKLLKIIP